MPMSSGGRVASSSGCATKPKAREIGWTGYAGLTQHSLRIGHYVMATAEHREPCDSRGSCTVLGAPGGEIPPGDSARSEELDLSISCPPLPPKSDVRVDMPVGRVCAKSAVSRCSEEQSYSIIISMGAARVVLRGR